MNKTIEFSINKKDNGERLDVFLSKKISNLTRSYIKKLIEKKQVQLNKIINTFPSTKIKVNDKINVNIIEKENHKLIPSKIELDITYEDKDILIVNKPKGMVVHPGAGNYENTLVNALIYKYKNALSSVNGNSRPGIVHRIDKETSGLLVIAKNNLSHSNLGKQFSDHSIKRKYQCLAWGVIRPLNGRIETLISRNKKNRQLMTVSDVNGKNAVTNYKTIKVFNIKDVPKISLVECELETGRTHQIRVHLKYKGASLLGDKQYGKKNIKFKKINKDFFNIMINLGGQALHAQTLEFIHPTKKKKMSFESKLPSDFKKMLDLLNNLNG
jgi:23S rRNA pseudouridine1911/1915/1917 synthase